VSAMMHAGLINGGGLLLVQFGPLYQQQPILLTMMFIAGVGTAIVATLWKLMQHDNKRMLACSTIAQMGFMLMQCGLGLFSAAVAHLCWHGLFKAYLFLWSGRAAAEKRITSSSLISMTSFSLALGCGALGGFIFSIVTGKNIMLFDSNTILVAIAMIASTQVAITVLSNRPWWYLLPAVIITSIGASLYGASIAFIHYLLPQNTDAPQPLNSFYLIGLGLLAVTWLLSLFRANLININWFNTLWTKYYMRILNASQPQAQTITTHVNHYSYQ
jgi:NAD(P)H-quinone oxidoreductase subunit 5